MQNSIDWTGAWRWTREQLPALIATFWMIAAFYALGGFLVYAFLQIDAEFSRPLAGGVVPPEVTQHLAWAVRAFSVIVGMAAMYCHVNEMPKFRGTLIGMGGVAALLLFLHAYGVSAKIMEGQYGRAAAITQIETAVTDTSATQIATLQTQIDAIRADRDRQVDRLQASINGIVGDGLNNDQLADAYRADQVAAEKDAQARLRPLEDQIAALTTASGATVVKATEDKTTVDSFNPLFTFMARTATWTWNPAVDPNQTAQFAAGFIFFTLFFGFGEILMMTCFPLAYGMQLVVAKRRETAAPLTEGVSADVPPGYVRAEWPEDEYNEREQVWQDFKKRSTAQKLRTKLPIAHKEWIKAKTDEIKLAYKTGASPQEIYDASGFVTWNEYEAFVRKIFSAKAADRILGAVAPKQDDPRAAKRMGDFMPQPEPEIDVDEPQSVASEPEPEDTPPADEPPKEPEKPLTNGALSIWQKPLPSITDDDEDEGAKRDELV